MPEGLTQVEHPIWMPFRNKKTMPNSADAFKKEEHSGALCGARQYNTWQKAGIASECLKSNIKKK